MFFFGDGVRIRVVVGGVVIGRGGVKVFFFVVVVGESEFCEE